MTKRTPEEFQAAHLDIWKERNRAKRDSLMADVYAKDIQMHDADFVLNGISEVSDFIDTLLEDPDFDFNPAKPLEMVQNGARLFWNIQTGKGLLTGMDFFVFENGKVAQLYVFMNPVN